MELVALKCPKCGGELEVHEGQKKTFCKYCGSQILLDDGIKRYQTLTRSFVTRRRAADTRTLHRSRGG